MFPLNRNRRLRQSPAVRALVRETSLSPADFIAPIFVVEGRQVREEIPSMPNYYRLSLDLVSAEVKSLWSLGIKSVLVFVKVPDALKDNRGKEAINPQGLMQRAVAEIKSACPELVVMTDVALDPYSVHGHDGIVEGSAIVNDPTVEVLTQMALSHIEAGADFVAPSDMMDGRVLRIRQAFEAAGHTNAGILSYSAKYASAYYGPFRDALDSAPGFGDKKTYQMDYANRREAISEAQNDIDEGADIIMVKPGLCYLDIVRELRDAVEVPIAAYQVSGEYAQLKAAAQKGWLDHDAVMIEQLFAFKRAGADLIATYFAADAARLL
ncbi:MAG: porphobilinogen synthase [Flavobacteriaceae bacterium]|nr:porphobilinogen synthase [Flavobacteriaceae bacterium]MDP4674672.1 porphobilinogen synthase [Flavobacteriaceae bacterium]MDP4755255.1 porphobilinogen synthase [Flavobacteriaceae bacterium]MDP4795244.1 porphobilinogen synthase [Flavobacteriaceae bacterium]MDP4886203.1 porphobilinogen synthase [Flavobacteriaceae bacterium]